MQSALTAAALCQPQQRKLEAPGNAQLTLVPARRRAAKARFAPSAAFGAAAASFGSSSASLQAMSQLASAVGFALAATWLGLVLKAEQDAMEAQGRRECETCGGTGRIRCICTKWSDRDVGCGACDGTGLMECTSCGGGGNAVPIEAKVYIKSQHSQRRDYY